MSFRLFFTFFRKHHMAKISDFINDEETHLAQKITDTDALAKSTQAESDSKVALVAALTKVGPTVKPLPDGTYVIYKTDNVGGYSKDSVAGFNTDVPNT